MSDLKRPRTEDLSSILINTLIRLYLDDRITADQADKLREMFLEGDGVTEQMVEQIRVGAERQLPLHQALFGQMQRCGWGVPRNEHEAMRLFRLSHEQGCAKGTYEYALCFLIGHGVDPDLRESVRLLREAYALYHPSHVRQGRGSYFVDARVVFALASCFEHGSGVRQNVGEGNRLYLEAACLGYSAAMLHMIAIFLYGIGVEQNLVEAARWIRRASALGHNIPSCHLYSIRQWDAEALNPYGEWRIPVGIHSGARAQELHQWVSKRMRQEMITALLVCKRFGIPRDVAVHHLLPFICSLPH